MGAIALTCPRCGGTLIAARDGTRATGIDTPLRCERCGTRFLIRLREQNAEVSTAPEPAADEPIWDAPRAPSGRVPFEAPRGFGLAWRRGILDLQRWVYPLGTGIGAAAMFGLGGFVPVLARWMRNDQRLSVAMMVETLGGAWAGNDTSNPDTNLGPILRRNDAPGLFAELDEITRRLGSRLPQPVRLTYLPCCGVVACGRRERALLVGLPLIGTLTHGELRAVLAHELSHWARGDASRAMRSSQFGEQIGSSMRRAQRDAGRWLRHGPLAGWARLNHRIAASLQAPIAHGQELRADRAAAAIAGGDVAASALMKVALLQPLFREALRHIESLGADAPCVYTFFRRFWDTLPADTVTRLRHGLFTQRHAEIDPAHPALLDRIALAQTYASPPRRDRSTPASEFLIDLECRERDMHARLFGLNRREASVFHHSGS